MVNPHPGIHTVTIQCASICNLHVRAKPFSCSANPFLLFECHCNGLHDADPCIGVKGVRIFLKLLVFIQNLE